MGIKARLVSLLFIIPLVSQGQFDLGISSGIRMSLGRIETNNSPQNTFRFGNTVSFPNTKVQLNFVHNNFIFGIEAERNSIFMTGVDNSQNVLFFPELQDSRGSRLNNGGRAATFNFKFGKQIQMKRWNFNIIGQLFYSKFKPHYENIGGIGSGSLDSLGNKEWEWQFTEWGDVRYYNNLQTFGLGLKLEIEYNVFHNFYLSLSNEVNKGFFKVMEKDYRTSFWSIDEPEKNATYFNSTAYFGSNYKCFIGLKYVFKKKQDRPED